MHRSLELGLIRIHILARAAQEPIYGARLLDELTRHGFQLSFGTLYPMLHTLEEEGLLTREDRVENGRLRKYYVATPTGHNALFHAQRLIDDAGDALIVIQNDGFPLPPHVDAGSLLIDLGVFHAWRESVDHPDPAVLDVRSAAEFRSGHLPGARHLPYTELGDRLKEICRRVPVVTCCMMQHHEAARSINAAALLRGHGYHAWALAGGLPAWVSADLPLER